MKRFLAIFCLLAWIALPALGEAALDEQQRLKQIQEQLEQSKKKLIETRQKEQESLSTLVTIKTELKQASRDLKRAQTKIVVNEGQIRELTVELKETEGDLSTLTARLRRRVREVYKSSAVNYLDLLFGARSMSDFINRSHFFSKIIEGDTGLIQSLNRTYQKTKVQKTQLIQVTGEIKDLAQEIKAKKETISEKAEQENKLYEELKERRADYERKIEELERSSAELERVIQAKMAERSRAGVYAHGTGALDWPLRGRITSKFGMRRHPYWGGRHQHTGLDIATSYGDPIRSADSGEVIFSGWWDGYGKAVVIDHGGNITTVYAHMSRIYAQNGAKITKGQIIGLVGSTGYSTGPHLHFEVRVKGRPQDPMRYLP
jgi:murein DD-endopeptidase MepM/ murein hydrolase activator NlpD